MTSDRTLSIPSISRQGVEEAILEQARCGSKTFLRYRYRYAADVSNHQTLRHNRHQRDEIDGHLLLRERKHANIFLSNLHVNRRHAQTVC